MIDSHFSLLEHNVVCAISVDRGSTVEKAEQKQMAESAICERGELGKRKNEKQVRTNEVERDGICRETR